MARQRGCFHRDIRIARQAAHIRELDERKVAARVDAERQVIDDEPQPGCRAAISSIFSQRLVRTP
jgi:hypothetical protein